VEVCAAKAEATPETFTRLSTFDAIVLQGKRIKVGFPDIFPLGNNNTGSPSRFTERNFIAVPSGAPFDVATPVGGVAVGGHSSLIKLSIYLRLTAGLYRFYLM
jgi:hypothetical protein